MKLRVYLPYLIFGISLIVIAICYFSTRRIYIEQYNTLIEKTREFYIEAVCKETEIRFKENSIPYVFEHTPDKTSRENFLVTEEKGVEYEVEKHRYYDDLSIINQHLLESAQSYLISKGIIINLSLVDSLVSVELEQKGFILSVASMYTNNLDGEKKWSNPDTSFYKLAKSVNSIELGFKQEFTLYPYVLLSFKNILFTSSNNPFIPYFISCLLALVILVFSGIWIIWGRQLAKMPVFAPLMGIRPEDIAPVEVVPNERPLQQRYLITKTIYLDVEREKVMEFDGRSVKLSKQMTDLMREFLHAEDRYLTYKEICVSLWGEVDINYSDRLSQLVKRLRKKLSLFPELSIDNKSGNGYQLLVHSVDEPPLDGPTAPEPIQKGDE